MARARRHELDVGAAAGAVAAGAGRGQKPARSLHTSRAATDLAQLLRAHAFTVAELGPAGQRVRANLQAGRGELREDAAVWIGLGPPPPDSLAIGLGEHAGVLGPHSFGFLNNIDGIAPLSVPVAERPRRGSVALVVPRRDALPEVVPLLCSHDLGVSWLISVGDADPAEVVRFLAIDPATTGVLLALGRGVRAPTLHGALGHKPVVVLEPPGLPLAGRDPALHRAVARRAGVPIVQDLEEWLAHGILLEAGAVPLGTSAPAQPERRGKGPARARAAIVVVGAGADLVSSEAGRAGLPAPVKLDIDDPQATAAALHKTAQRAELVVLCGPSSDTAELKPPLPTLRVDPAQPERLRALLRAVALPPRQPDDHQPVAATGDAARVQTVLADLPPPLYLSGAVVSDEPLGDHDCKRLLHAYGVQVSRQAPVNTSTAALRVLTKLGLPVLLVPPQAPAGDGLAAALAEERAATLCTTQAEVKRHATLLLAKHPYILLREVIPAGPRLRALVSPERGLGPVLRLARVRPGPGPGPGSGEWSAEADWQAALVPLRRGEARELAGLLAAADGAPPAAAAQLDELLGQLSSCATAHDLRLDLLIALAPEPVVVHAAGELKREAR